jgi:predicted MFS family arabinose efflux permease
MKTLMLWMAMNRGQKPHLGAGIAVSTLMLLCALGVIFYGVTSGYWQWMMIGGIWAALCAVTTAVLIFLNIRRNRPRW